MTTQRPSEAADLLEVTKELLEEYKNFGQLVIGISRTVRETSEVLNDIHILVNSEKTAALERELNATKRELILLRELGRPEKVIQEAEKTIAELRQTLRERAAAQRQVDAGG